MKATGLKTGDWVSVDGEPLKIAETDLTYFTAWKKDGTFCGKIGYEAAEPIVLTEDILEKTEECWIKKSLGGVTIAVIPMDEKQDRILILSSEYNPATDEDEWITSIGYYYVPTGARFAQPQEFAFLRKIRYTHELQHLLWALGIEKEVQL